MIKRLVIALILFSMVLHSASRLGVLSYLYKQRHEIAFALGMIAEIPIAMCNSDYEFNHELILHGAQDGDQTTPAVLLPAHEIHLFVDEPSDFLLEPQHSIAQLTLNTSLREAPYPSPPVSIFHPPS